ncbi:hypothetical protein SNEBB_009928 [Seison nebaliae]|nr:hypothetical protein SNEBB_009928 [Seison nebaliae]
MLPIGKNDMELQIRSVPKDVSDDSAFKQKRIKASKLNKVGIIAGITIAIVIILLIVLVTSTSTFSSSSASATTAPTTIVPVATGPTVLVNSTNTTEQQTTTAQQTSSSTVVVVASTTTTVSPAETTEATTSGKETSETTGVAAKRTATQEINIKIDVPNDGSTDDMNRQDLERTKAKLAESLTNQYQSREDTKDTFKSLTITSVEKVEDDPKKLSITYSVVSSASSDRKKRQAGAFNLCDVNFVASPLTSIGCFVKGIYAITVKCETVVQPPVITEGTVDPPEAVSFPWSGPRAALRASFKLTFDIPLSLVEISSNSLKLVLKYAMGAILQKADGRVLYSFDIQTPSLIGSTGSTKCEFEFMLSNGKVDLQVGGTPLLAYSAIPALISGSTIKYGGAKLSGLSLTETVAEEDAALLSTVDSIIVFRVTCNFDAALKTFLPLDPIIFSLLSDVKKHEQIGFLHSITPMQLSEKMDAIILEMQVKKTEYEAILAKEGGKLKIFTGLSVKKNEKILATIKSETFEKQEDPGTIMSNEEAEKWDLAKQGSIKQTVSAKLAISGKMADFSGQMVDYIMPNSKEYRQFIRHLHADLVEAHNGTVLGNMYLDHIISSLNVEKDGTTEVQLYVLFKYIGLELYPDTLMTILKDIQFVNAFELDGTETKLLSTISSESSVEYEKSEVVECVMEFEPSMPLEDPLSKESIAALKEINEKFYEAFEDSQELKASKLSLELTIYIVDNFFEFDYHYSPAGLINPGVNIAKKIQTILEGIVVTGLTFTGTPTATNSGNGYYFHIPKGGAIDPPVDALEILLKVDGPSFSKAEKASLAMYPDVAFNDLFMAACIDLVGKYDATLVPMLFGVTKFALKAVGAVMEITFSLASGIIPKLLFAALEAVKAIKILDISVGLLGMTALSVQSLLKSEVLKGKGAADMVEFVWPIRSVAYDAQFSNLKSPLFKQFSSSLNIAAIQMFSGSIIESFILSTQISQITESGSGVNAAVMCQLNPSFGIIKVAPILPFLMMSSGIFSPKANIQLTMGFEADLPAISAFNVITSNAASLPIEATQEFETVLGCVMEGAPVTDKPIAEVTQALQIALSVAMSADTTFGAIFAGINIGSIGFSPSGTLAFNLGMDCGVPQSNNVNVASALSTVLGMLTTISLQIGGAAISLGVLATQVISNIANLVFTNSLGGNSAGVLKGSFGLDLIGLPTGAPIEELFVPDSPEVTGITKSIQSTLVGTALPMVFAANLGIDFAGLFSGLSLSLNSGMNQCLVAFALDVKSAIGVLGAAAMSVISSGLNALVSLGIFADIVFDMILGGMAFSITGIIAGSFQMATMVTSSLLLTAVEVGTVLTPLSVGLSLPMPLANFVPSVFEMDCIGVIGGMLATLGFAMTVTLPNIAFSLVAGAVAVTFDLVLSGFGLGFGVFPTIDMVLGMFAGLGTIKLPLLGIVASGLGFALNLNLLDMSFSPLGIMVFGGLGSFANFLAPIKGFTFERLQISIQLAPAFNFILNVTGLAIQLAILSMFAAIPALLAALGTIIVMGVTNGALFLELTFNLALAAFVTKIEALFTAALVAGGALFGMGLLTLNFLELVAFVGGAAFNFLLGVIPSPLYAWAGLTIAPGGPLQLIQTSFSLMGIAWNLAFTLLMSPIVIGFQAALFAAMLIMPGFIWGSLLAILNITGILEIAGGIAVTMICGFSSGMFGFGTLNLLAIIELVIANFKGEFKWTVDGVDFVGQVADVSGVIAVGDAPVGFGAIAYPSIRSVATTMVTFLLNVPLAFAQLGAGMLVQLELALGQLLFQALSGIGLLSMLNIPNIYFQASAAGGETMVDCGLPFLIKDQLNIVDFAPIQAAYVHLLAAVSFGGSILKVGLSGFNIEPIKLGAINVGEIISPFTIQDYGFKLEFPTPLQPTAFTADMMAMFFSAFLAAGSALSFPAFRLLIGSGFNLKGPSLTMNCGFPVGQITSQDFTYQLLVELTKSSIGDVSFVPLTIDTAALLTREKKEYSTGRVGNEARPYCMNSIVPFEFDLNAFGNLNAFDYPKLAFVLIKSIGNLFKTSLLGELFLYAVMQGFRIVGQTILFGLSIAFNVLPGFAATLSSLTALFSSFECLINFNGAELPCAVKPDMITFPGQIEPFGGLAVGTAEIEQPLPFPSSLLGLGYTGLPSAFLSSIVSFQMTCFFPEIVPVASIFKAFGKVQLPLVTPFLTPTVGISFGSDALSISLDQMFKMFIGKMASGPLAVFADSYNDCALMPSDPTDVDLNSFQIKMNFGGPLSYNEASEKFGDLQMLLSKMTTMNLPDGTLIKGIKLQINNLYTEIQNEKPKEIAQPFFFQFSTPEIPETSPLMDLGFCQNMVGQSILGAVRLALPNFNIKDISFNSFQRLSGIDGITQTAEISLVYDVFPGATGETYINMMDVIDVLGSELKINLPEAYGEEPYKFKIDAATETANEACESDEILTSGSPIRYCTLPGGFNVAVNSFNGTETFGSPLAAIRVEFINRPVNIQLAPSVDLASPLSALDSLVAADIASLFSQMMPSAPVSPLDPSVLVLSAFSGIQCSPPNVDGMCPCNMQFDSGVVGIDLYKTFEESLDAAFGNLATMMSGLSTVLSLEPIPVSEVPLFSSMKFTNKLNGLLSKTIQVTNVPSKKFSMVLPSIKAVDFPWAPAGKKEVEEIFTAIGEIPIQGPMSFLPPAMPRLLSKGLTVAGEFLATFEIPLPKFSLVNKVPLQMFNEWLADLSSIPGGDMITPLNPPVVGFPIPTVSVDAFFSTFSAAVGGISDDDSMDGNAFVQMNALKSFFKFLFSNTIFNNLVVWKDLNILISGKKADITVPMCKWNPTIQSNGRSDENVQSLVRASVEDVTQLITDLFETKTQSAMSYVKSLFDQPMDIEIEINAASLGITEGVVIDPVPANPMSGISGGWSYPEWRALTAAVPEIKLPKFQPAKTFVLYLQMPEGGDCSTDSEDILSVCVREQFNVGLATLPIPTQSIYNIFISDVHARGLGSFVAHITIPNWEPLPLADMLKIFAASEIVPSPEIPFLEQTVYDSFIGFDFCTRSYDKSTQLMEAVAEYELTDYADKYVKDGISLSDLFLAKFTVIAKITSMFVLEGIKFNPMMNKIGSYENLEITKIISDIFLQFCQKYYIDGLYLGARFGMASSSPTGNVALMDVMVGFADSSGKPAKIIQNPLIDALGRIFSFENYGEPIQAITSSYFNKMTSQIIPCKVEPTTAADYSFAVIEPTEIGMDIRMEPISIVPVQFSVAKKNLKLFKDILTKPDTQEDFAKEFLRELKAKINSIRPNEQLPGLEMFPTVMVEPAVKYFVSHLKSIVAFQIIHLGDMALFDFQLIFDAPIMMDNMLMMMMPDMAQLMQIFSCAKSKSGSNSNQRIGRDGHELEEHHFMYTKIYEENYSTEKWEKNSAGWMDSSDKWEDSSAEWDGSTDKWDGSTTDSPFSNSSDGPIPEEITPIKLAMETCRWVITEPFNVMVERSQI